MNQALHEIFALFILSNCLFPKEWDENGNSVSRVK